MSAPIQTEDEIGDGLKYAPPWARGIDRATHQPPKVQASPAMAPGVGGPNIDPPPFRSPTFEGDIGIIHVRRQLSLQPEIAPQPPFVRQRKRAWAPVAGLACATILAAMVALGVTMMSLAQPEARSEKGDRVLVSSMVPIATGIHREDGPSKSIARLVLGSRQAYANEPLPLRLALTGASGNESVTVAGLAAGTRLSDGTPLDADVWRIAARDVGSVVAYSPKDFVGAMDATVALHSPGNALVDSRMIRLEWIANQAASPSIAKSHSDEDQAITALRPAVAASPPIQHLDPGEMDMLLRRGREFLKNGDIAAARLVLRRAADGGSADAALELGATYDPEFLKELGVLGFAPDGKQARSWYQRAAELGSHDATRLMDRLAQAR